VTTPVLFFVFGAVVGLVVLVALGWPILRGYFYSWRLRRELRRYGHGRRWE